MCVRNRRRHLIAPISTAVNPYIIETFRRAIPLMDREPVKHHLWIIEETRVRIRD